MTKNSSTTSRPEISGPPVGNYIIMLMMSIIFAAQFLCDSNQIHLTGLILKRASLSSFLGYFWLHTGLTHIISNMLLLAVFGRHICVKLGHAKYFLLYVLLGFAAACAHLLLDGRSVIGASGAIFGVMGMAVVLSYRKFSPCAPWLILIWIFLSLAVALATETPLAHITHVAGFVMGMILATVMIFFKQADHSDTCYSLVRILRIVAQKKVQTEPIFA